MGLGLGLGLIAADSYFKADDARKEREYTQAKRDAELSNLDMETRNKRARLGLEGVGLEGDMGRAGKVNQTKDIQANMGLSDAQNAQANQPAKQEVANNTLKSQQLSSADELKHLPAKLERAAVQGVLDEQGQSDVVLGTMAQLIATNDKTKALEFSNKVAQQGNLLPGTNGKTFVDIQPVKRGENGAQGDGYNFLTSDGQSKFVPVEAMAAAQQKMKTGKYSFLHTPDGSVYSGNQSTGSVTQVHKGDPSAMRAQHTPAEVQTMNWLIANKVAKDPAAAWDQVRSAREKTRTQFIVDFVSKNALPGQDGNKVAVEAGKIYDQVKQSVAPPNQQNPTSNTQATPTMDPEIQNLIGIPSQ